MKNMSDLAIRTAEMVTIPRTEYEELKPQNQWLLEQLRVMRSKKFGSSSEKAMEEVYAQLSLLFNEAETYAAKADEPKETAVPVRALPGRENPAASGIFSRRMWRSWK